MAYMAENQAAIKWGGLPIDQAVVNPSETWSDCMPLVWNGTFYSVSSGLVGYSSSVSGTTVADSMKPYIVVFPGWNNIREDVVDVKSTKAAFGPMQILTNAVAGNIYSNGDNIAISGGAYVPSANGVVAGSVVRVVGGGYYEIRLY